MKVDDRIVQKYIDECFLIGERRYELAVRLNRSQPRGDPGDENRLEIDQWSCVAEKIVSVYLNLPWHKELLTNLYPKPPDVGDNIDVKWTKYTNGHLILHESDLSDRVFVLVRGKPPEMEIRGWVIGEVAKKERFQNHLKARSSKDYWFPARRLEHMSALQEILEESNTEPYKANTTASASSGPSHLE